jgi:hypothetical protein
VRSNTQQRQKLGFVPYPMPCIAGRYLRIRNALYFYKALIFCLLFDQAKSKKKLKYFYQSFGFDDSQIAPQNKN